MASLAWLAVWANLKKEEVENDEISQGGETGVVVDSGEVSVVGSVGEINEEVDNDEVSQVGETGKVGDDDAGEVGEVDVCEVSVVGDGREVSEVGEVSEYRV